LAGVLRLPPAALDVLPIGWWPDRRWWNPETNQEEGEPGCWTFAEYDSQDRIVGVGLRWPAGHKGQLAGGRRGLILPADWRDLPDPVIVAEGPSDVLAGRAVGLNVIGRPSNSGGSELLAQVCRHRQVIILGENDRRQDGRWPGKDGAEAVARKLEADWCRPVPVAYPPPDRKDLRTWIVGLAPNLGNTDTADLGATIFEALRPPRVQLLVGAPDKRDRVVVSAFRWAEGPDAAPIHSDRLHPDQDSARQRFAKALRQAEPQTDVDQVTQRLMSIGIPRTGTPCGPAGNGGRSHDPDASVLPVVFLPGGPVSIQESAGKLGVLLDQTEHYLLRGGAVVTTAQDDAGHSVLETIKPAGLASAFEMVARLLAFSRDEGARPAICFGGLLTGTTGLTITRDGRVQIVGRIALPPAMEVLRARDYEKTLFEPSELRIPILGVSVGSHSVGIFAFIRGRIGFRAQVGPGMLRDTSVEVESNPYYPEQTPISCGSRFEVAAEAGLSLTATGGIGAGLLIVDATGGVGLEGTLGLAAMAAAQVGIECAPPQGLALAARLSAEVRPKLDLALVAAVRVTADIGTAEWDHHKRTWRRQLAGFGPDIVFGVAFPARWGEQNGLDLSLDNITVTVPDIDVAAIGRNVLEAVVG
jgi:hypothetical protein